MRVELVDVIRPRFGRRPARFLLSRIRSLQHRSIACSNGGCARTFTITGGCAEYPFQTIRIDPDVAVHQRPTGFCLAYCSMDAVRIDPVAIFPWMSNSDDFRCEATRSIGVYPVDLVKDGRPCGVGA